MSRTDILSFSLSRCCKYEIIDSVLYSAMALKVMKDSDFEKLIEHQLKSRRLAGSWAIPLDLLILSYSDRDALDDILEPELIRRVFFGEDIDEEKWLREITEKICEGYI